MRHFEMGLTVFFHDARIELCARRTTLHNVMIKESDQQEASTYINKPIWILNNRNKNAACLMIRRTTCNPQAAMTRLTGPRQRYPLDTHDKNQNQSYERTTRILLLFLILLFLVTMNGDAKNHSTMRRTTVNHVVMLSAPFLFIFGIISLASMRERNMDLHHSRHHEWVYHHVPPWCWCWESSEWNCFFVVE